ncbi:MAG: cbb3-type cytochrome c oxidase subunit I [Hylemonella sp.]|nr:cbb3-type cytochrome c oxidase subunit I [Hylemonella sp.]
MNTTTQDTVHRTPAVAEHATLRGFDYVLPVPTDERQRLARGWLWLSLLALIGSGVFSILLVLARTPGVNRLLPGVDFFRIALVVHVDLSVLVWFVAVAGLLWSINGARAGLRWGWGALVLAGAGTTLMSLAAFIAPGEAIMANYIPMLDSPLFITGTLVLGSGVLLLVLRAMLGAPKVGLQIDGAGALHFGINAAAVATAVALMAFVWSYVVLPQDLVGKAYYEILFWGGGHALQFTWTLLMLVGWLWLASICGARLPISPRLTVLMFVLALASVFVTPYAYLAYDVATVEHRNLHTWAMRLGGGIAIAPIALAVVTGLWPARGGDASTRPLRAALVSSMALFAAGGLIGAMINGSNVKIPAHYHGCIVGVTLAFMGLVYHLLPRLGYGAVRGRMATLQPYLYGAGQLLHIIGLVWSGGYGVQRKVAGSEQVLRSTAEVFGMGLMGLGGLVAIIGGLLFVLVVIRAMRQPAGAAGVVTS